MKVKSLHATNVHGYLPIDVAFRPDLTFLTGLNGSGKTSALRLLMGLLAPKLDELASIAFDDATVIVIEEGREIAIRCHRLSNSLSLSVSGVDGELDVSPAEALVLADPRRAGEEPSTLLQNKFHAHSVYKAIAKMSTPMFLGLDRRHAMYDGASGDLADVRRREIMMRRRWDEGEPIRGSVAAGLQDVNALVQETMAEIRARQERLDNDLRSKILLRAFTYKPSDILSISDSPNRVTLEKYRKRQAEFERAAAGLRLPVADVQGALNEFFEKMNITVDSLEKTMQGKKKKAEPSKSWFEWIVNKPQADRIFEHLELLETYSVDRNRLRDPIDRFVGLANSFLKQTGKYVSVSERGSLEVAVTNPGERRSIGALSSGERQIVVMLAHLALNKRLTGSGVFIVDEPELSLHIAWQERFVDAILEANPSVQLIMATHSPAIILDRGEAHCRSLS
jgi:predicted ATPase